MRLDDQARDHFADAVEASVQVQSRQQFFVWTQSAVQGLVPHEILLCGVREPKAAGLTLTHFTASRYFRQPQFEAVADPVKGLLPMLQAAADGEAAVVTCAADEQRASLRDLKALVQTHEMRNLAGRVLCNSDGQVAAVYVFSRIGIPLDGALCHAVELLVPHLHHTFQRVLRLEHERQPMQPSRDGAVVTRRQQEILLLIKDGKTNSEIAQELDCSQWTVKNHIQNILRRLNTSSRAHAISRAMSLGILRPD